MSLRETLLSVGIDIGTSTTQLIFSRLVIENKSQAFAIPNIHIVEKEVIYRSNIYFTPLTYQTEIDIDKVKEIVVNEYQKAKIKPQDLTTGAVMITGEAARKTNADDVLMALSDMAGDFVVATAGPDLESFLSAKGAGVDKLSDELRKVLVNIDIGGGTSNLALFQNGELKDTTCLDIGGRLIKIEQGKISYIFPKIAKLAHAHGIFIHVGDEAHEEELLKVCCLMVDQLAMAVSALSADSNHVMLYTDDSKPLADVFKIDGLTYSGGVADCIDQDDGYDVYRYGDIGILLGKAIKNNQHLKQLKNYPAIETIRATVVGVGTHTTNISGSSINYTEGVLPVKNVPVIVVSTDQEQKLESFKSAIENGLSLYVNNGRLAKIALAFSGNYHTNFKQIKELAEWLCIAARRIIDSGHPLILVLRNDIAKALGNALRISIGNRLEIICIDGISIKRGDYIDIGEPIAEGLAVPVITKTLIFNQPH